MPVYLLTWIKLSDTYYFFFFLYRRLYSVKHTTSSKETFSPELSLQRLGNCSLQKATEIHQFLQLWSLWDRDILRMNDPKHICSKLHVEVQNNTAVGLSTNGGNCHHLQVSRMYNYFKTCLQLGKRGCFVMKIPKHVT